MKSKEKSCIIWANGKRPKKKTVNKLLEIGYEKIICADGGANSAYCLNITPDYIIGDFDSVKKEVLEKFRASSEIIHLARQNDTDLEKALKFVIKKKFTRAVLIATTGDRLDHSLCNVGILLKFYGKIDLKLVHEKTVAYVRSGVYSFPSIKGETISIYAFDGKTKITSHGLKYPLKNTALPFGQKESTSNEATKDTVTLEIKTGKVMIVRELKVLFEHGYFLDA